MGTALITNCSWIAGYIEKGELQSPNKHIGNIPRIGQVQYLFDPFIQEWANIVLFQSVFVLKYMSNYVETLPWSITGQSLERQSQDWCRLTCCGCNISRKSTSVGQNENNNWPTPPIFNCDALHTTNVQS